MQLRETGVMRAPETVLFGAGAAGETGRIVSRYGTRVLICTDSYFASSPRLAKIADSLRAADCEVQVLAEAEPELPLTVVERAVGRAAPLRPECLVALGGGSSLDLAKLIALALTAGLPLDRWYGENAVPGSTLPVVALPTTAGTGSEVTPVAVLTDPGRTLKVGISSPFLIPRAAICDPLLTQGAPPEVTAHAGIDALAHAIEAYCAVRRTRWEDIDGRVFVGQNVLSDSFALRAVSLIGSSLGDAPSDDPVARENMALGSLYGGLAFGTAGTGLAHALQYPIGARTGTPHGLGIGLLLPYTMAFNASATANRLAVVGRALGAGDGAADAVRRVRDLGAEVGIPSRLGAIGIDSTALGEIAAQALSIDRLIENNPRSVTAEDLRGLLEQALTGDPDALLP